MSTPDQQLQRYLVGIEGVPLDADATDYVKSYLNNFTLLRGRIVALPQDLSFAKKSYGQYSYSNPLGVTTTKRITRRLKAHGAVDALEALENSLIRQIKELETASQRAQPAPSRLSRLRSLFSRSR